MPFVSAKSVPSKRACSILTDGASDWNVTVRSTVGVAAAVPWTVTCHVACACLVVPVNVPDVMSLQPRTLAPTWRHMWVLAGVAPADVATLAEILPGPSVVNVTILGSASGGPVGSSLRARNVRVASGTGGAEAEGAALGDALGLAVAAAVALEVGAVEALCDADGLADPMARLLPGDAVAVSPERPGPPRDTMTSTPAARTTTRSVAIAPISRRRVWSVTAPS